MHGVQRPRSHFANEQFGAIAVLNQVGNGAYFQAMRGGKPAQLGQARHGAVFVHDFANYRRWRAAGHAC